MTDAALGTLHPAHHDDDDYDDEDDEDDEIKSYKIVYYVYFVSGRFHWGVFCLLLLTQQMKHKKNYGQSTGLQEGMIECLNKRNWCDIDFVFKGEM